MSKLVKTIPHIALTGGIGSGKSAAAKEFESLGVPIIDSDAIAHLITSPGGAGIAAIQVEFGDAFITQDGALDRPKMREHVFNDPSALGKLEAITHPLIRQASDLAANKALEKHPAYIIFMIPLLFESSGWQTRFAKTVVVDCSVDTQITRVVKRNHLQKELIEKIIATQAPRAMRLQYADYVLKNDGALEDLQAQVQEVHLQILSLPQE
jgi:dephospho-CoA kinase